MNDDLAELRRAEIQRLDNKVDRLREALKPFADLGAKLDGAPNLVGLLTEDDFRRAGEVFRETRPSTVETVEK